MGIKFEGDFETTKPRNEVYTFLANPERFCPCLPTYESLEMEDDRTAVVKIKIGVGKIRGTATITLVLELVRPDGQPELRHCEANALGDAAAAVLADWQEALASVCAVDME